jgi:hypothetical protein
MHDPTGELPGHQEADVPADPMSVAVEDIPVIEVPDGLPGYPDARAFVLERLDDLGALGTLRALGYQGPAFFVVPPRCGSLAASQFWTRSPARVSSWPSQRMPCSWW